MRRPIAHGERYLRGILTPTVQMPKSALASQEQLFPGESLKRIELIGLGHPKRSGLRLGGQLHVMSLSRWSHRSLISLMAVIRPFPSSRAGGLFARINPRI
jgi:hypothetical protein